MAEQVRVENSYLKHKARPYVFKSLFLKIQHQHNVNVWGFLMLCLLCVTVCEQVRSSCSLKTPSSGDDPKQQPAATEGHDRI